jgi:hypothetical protein
VTQCGCRVAPAGVDAGNWPSRPCIVITHELLRKDRADQPETATRPRCSGGSGTVADAMSGSSAVDLEQLRRDGPAYAAGQCGATGPSQTGNVPLTCVVLADRCANPELIVRPYAVEV